MTKKPIYRVEEDKRLVRDTGNRFILNTDLEGLRAYKEKKNERAKINNLEKRVDELSSDIRDIKDMISLIAKKVAE